MVTAVTMAHPLCDEKSAAYFCRRPRAHNSIDSHAACPSFMTPPICMPLLDRELLNLLVCPDKQTLSEQSDWLCCTSGHRYRVIGVLILLVSEARKLILKELEPWRLPRPETNHSCHSSTSRPGGDPFVETAIGATNGSSISIWLAT